MEMQSKGLFPAPRAESFDDSKASLRESMHGQGRQIGTKLPGGNAPVPAGHRINIVF